MGASWLPGVTSRTGADIHPFCSNISLRCRASLGSAEVRGCYGNCAAYVRAGRRRFASTRVSRLSS